MGVQGVSIQIEKNEGETDLKKLQFCVCLCFQVGFKMTKYYFGKIEAK